MLAFLKSLFVARHVKVQKVQPHHNHAAGGCDCTCPRCDIGNHCGENERGCYFYDDDDDE